jgi:hypothetical protein
MRRYLIAVEEAGSNLAAYVPDLPGCIATGETEEEDGRVVRGPARPGVTYNDRIDRNASLRQWLGSRPRVAPEYGAGRGTRRGWGCSETSTRLPCPVESHRGVHLRMSNRKPSPSARLACRGGLPPAR